MPRTLAAPPETGLLSTRPGAEAFILANYTTMSLMQLSRETKVRYANISQFLARRKLKANRYGLKRRNLHPFLSMSDTDTAYMAGLVDGEGTISYRLDGHHLQPFLIITNTSWIMRQWVVDRGFYVNEAKNRLGRGYFRFSMTGFELEMVLTRLLPYLVVKRLHALILLWVIRLRKQQPLRGPLPAEALNYLKVLRLLNTRGFRFETEQASLSRYTMLSQKLVSSLQLEC